MDKRESRKILEEMNRGALREIPKKYTDDQITDNNSVREPALVISSDGADLKAFEEAVPGQVVSEGEGDFLLIRHEAEIPLFLNAEKKDSFPAVMKRLSGTIPEFSGMSVPENILFLDIETCGLSAVPLFLIGAMYFHGGSFTSLQMFARNYEEERPLLLFFSRFLTSYDFLVTYNGKSFDMPFIVSRGNENRVPVPRVLKHLDLLHEVRKRWRRAMPDCRLQTVEKQLLGFSRSGDIPGSEIPRAYSDFVTTGKPEEIVRILEHNVRDIISMIELMSHIDRYSAESINGTVNR